MMDKPAVTQHKMDRIVLGITLRDQKQNIWIHQETGVSNIINAIRKQSIDGQVKLHSYLITVGPSEQQSGPKESGPEK